MPRISREPAPDLLPEDRAVFRAWGDGTSTFDVCHDCCPEDGSPWPEDDNKLKPYNDEPVGLRYVVNVGVEHPGYDGSYSCCICRRKLDPVEDN